MPLLNIQHLNLSYGEHVIFDDANLTIDARERICLIGRNGAGKSTLLKLIMGDQDADAGQIERQQGLTLSALAQEIPLDFTGTIFDVVTSGLGEIGSLLTELDHIHQQLESDHSEQILQKMGHIQQQIEQLNGWEVDQRVKKVISQVNLTPHLQVTELSGGLRRRVLLAKALVTDPDILILDEPTNHLDIEAINWLEFFLLNYKKTIIFVSHDRSFMQAIATRIVEIDQGKFYSWSGRYLEYLKHKEERLHAEEKQNALFDKKLAQEEVWIRQGIKARRTRNEGRVRALKKMREQRKQRRARPGTSKITMQSFKDSGKIVFEAEKVSYAYQDKPILAHFSTIIARGDKVGIIGPNGSGKSTLLKLLLKKLAPDTGSVTQGTQLNISYFDQYRQNLDPEQTVQQNVYDGGEFIDINGKSVHTMSYLQDFLFSPTRARTKVKVLSGGERNRLLLAKLFTQPSNVLIMDEPTNDLDIETLELLEEQLLNYTGTLLLVSHDRTFLNNIVTSTLVLEDSGHVGEYIGGYDDWIRQKTPTTTTTTTIKAEATDKKPQIKSINKKLSYNDQRELDQLPDKISTLETDIAQLQETICDPDFYKKEEADIQSHKTKLAELENKLSQAYERWELLDKKSNEG